MLSKAGIQNLVKHLNPSSQVVMRADFNVPIKQGKVADANRIKATIPTIQQLLKHNPKSLVLLSHLGRPNGKRNQKHSLRPIINHLSQYLNRKVTFLDDCVGNNVIDQVQRSNNEVFLCQNVRFHIQEEGSYKDNEGKKIKANPQSIKQFRNQLSQLGNVYVNDAFGTAHRAHSSVVGIAHKYRVAGLLMQKQLNYFGQFIQKPKKPVLVIMGGAKVSDKINLIKNMINIADQIIIGGGMINPFLEQVYGIKLGRSKVFMPQNPKILHQILEYGKEKNCKIHFPNDYVLGKQLQTGTQTQYWQNWQKDIPSQMRVLDCGPKSSQKFDSIISNAKSIFWNGPFGYIQAKQFRQGSQNILKSIIKQTKNGATSIIGGGDSASLINNMGLKNQVSYVSTGGGATLELLQGKVLPGVKGLSQKSQL